MPLVRHQDREGDGMIGDGARMHLVRQTSGGWMEEPNFLAWTRQEVKLVGQLGGSGRGDSRCVPLFLARMREKGPSYTQ